MAVRVREPHLKMSKRQVLLWLHQSLMTKKSPRSVLYHTSIYDSYHCKLELNDAPPLPPPAISHYHPSSSFQPRLHRAGNPCQCRHRPARHTPRERKKPSFQSCGNYSAPSKQPAAQA